MSTAPPGGSCAPGGTCVPCTTGNLHIRVFLQTVCWDTDPKLGENSPDRPFDGVFVDISGPTYKPRQRTINGEAFFSGLAPGDYSVIAYKEGFDDVSTDIYQNHLLEGGITPDLLVNSYEVTCHNTTEAVRVMRRHVDTSKAPVGSKHLECTRKHTVKTPGVPGTRAIPIPVFWFPWDEPWIMWLRDFVWVICLVSMIVALATGEYCMGAFFAAFAAYLTTVIFGEIPGIISMVAAGAGWVAAMIAATIQYAMGGHPDPVWIGFVSGTWAGFLYALARGRRPEFYNTEKFEIIVGGIIGLVVAVVLFFVYGGGFDTPQDVGDGIGMVLLAILLLFLAFLFSALGALFSHVFTNDNKLEGTLHWLEDFLLPYAGEHYCVQGHRGFISHSTLNVDQEFSYDWEFPLGTPILNAKEGHIIKDVVEHHDGSRGINLFGWQIVGEGNDYANEIKVRHFDGSVANYLHLIKGGVTGINSLIPPAVDNEPLHAYTGTRIAQAGNVGISMFSHLHFMVDRGSQNPPDPGETSARRPVKFKDADTARHGNRCYSMRKYLSANLDMGPVRVPDRYPPFRPGGPPTDGSQFPAAPLTPPSAGAPGMGDAPPPGSPPSGPAPPGTPPVPSI